MLTLKQGYGNTTYVKLTRDNTAYALTNITKYLINLNATTTIDSATYADIFDSTEVLGTGYLGITIGDDIVADITGEYPRASLHIWDLTLSPDGLPYIWVEDIRINIE